MADLTDEELAELRTLANGGEATALEWRAAVLAAHPFLLAEVERRRKEEAEIAALAEPPEATLEKAKSRAADRDPLKPK